MKVILHVNSDFAKEGGIGYRTYCIAKELDKRNQLKKVICRDYNRSAIPRDTITRTTPLFKWLSLGLTAINQFIIPRFQTWKVRRYLFDLLSVGKIEACDIYHTWDGCAKSMRKAKSLGAQVFFDIQMGINKESWFRYVDYFIAPSDHVVKECKKLGIPPRKIIKNPFGVDIENYVPGKKSSKFTCLFVGVLERRKGIEYLLKAWKKLNLTDAELLICGRKTKTTEKIIKRLGGSKTVRFLGQVKHNKLPQIYQECSLFVFPSLKEGSAKVTYEAMATGLPVITTPNAGSVVRDGKDGFIVPEKDTRAIAEKILYFYRHPKLVNTMGKSARKHVEKFTWEAYGKRVVGLYERSSKK